ncbi:histidine kinase dimerization/phospho-acceptor domain-containing protein [Wenyingzhuangia sp. 1_MG-2023]|nr:histidine kinase dimerization/phospho-acceptor domain-containing protein [Wenyingzhuangia sp. 1_MG-2023]
MVSLANTTVLPTAEINKIKQDSKGFIWLATEEGLFRFDGYKYEQHAFLDKDFNFPLRRIKKIEFDSYNRIWLITKDNTLYVYSLTTKELTKIRFVENVGIDIVNSMTICNDTIFIGAVRLFYFSLTEDVFNKIRPTSVTAPKAGSRFGFTKNKSVYFSLSNHLLIIETQNGVQVKEVLKTPNKVSNISIDDHNRIWLGTYEGLYTYNEKQKDWIQLPEFKGLLIKEQEYDKDKKGIWVTTLKKTVFVYTENQNFKTEEIVLVDLKNQVDNRGGFLDKQGVFWLYKENDLIKIFSYHNNFKVEKIANHQLVNDKRIKAIYQDFTDSYWFGTENDGVFVKNKMTRKIEHLLRNQHVNSITETKEKQIVVVGTTSGVIFFKYDNLQKKFKKFKELNEFPMNGVVSAVDLGENTLLTSNTRGLHKLTNKNSTSNIKTILTWDDINYVTLNKEKNRFFAGSENKGLFWGAINNKKEVIKTNNITQAKKLASNTVKMVCEANGFLWVATSSGLSKLKENRSKQYEVHKNYTTQNGLAHNNIQSIIAQNDSILWMGTKDGLNKFNTRSEVFTTLYKGEGFKPHKFLERSVFRSKKGNLFFGVNNELIVFNPNELQKKENQYNTYIENIRINDTISVSLTKLQELSYLQNNISFSVKIPNYISPSGVNYRYQVNNNAWKVKLASDDIIGLSNLSYGNYSIKIQASNEYGVWNKEIKEINIKIAPPFWLTWWFILLIFIVLISLVVVYVQFRVKTITFKKELRLRLQFEKKLRETDQEKIKFFTNVSHDLKTPLTMIMEPLDKIRRDDVDEVEKEFLLDTATKNANRLVALVHQVLSFSTIQTGDLTLNIQKIAFVDFIRSIVMNYQFKANQKQINLCLETRVNEVEVFIDKEKIERVVYNIVSNAFKNTFSGGKILFNIYTDKEQKELILEIRDTGKGIKKLRKAYVQWWDETLPFMINEDREYDGVEPPLVTMYKKQKAEKGIPNWEPLNID